MFPKKIKIAATFFLLSFLLFPNISRAITTETLGILPANPDSNVMFSDVWLVYNLDLNQSKNDGIRIINRKDETAVVKIYPADAGTTSDGSFSIAPEESSRKDVGAWVKLAAKEIEVAPHTEKTVPFIITIPKNADAGDHMGGIVIQEIDTTPMVGVGFKIITRIGLRIYETVPGPIKKDFEVTRLDYQILPSGVKNLVRDILDINKKTVFLVGIKNEGNMKFIPRVSLDIKNIFGRKVVSLPPEEAGVVFPRGENSDSTIVWNSVPLLGRYTAKLTIDSQLPDVPKQTREIVIWAFPYKAAFLLVILIIIIILLRLIVKYFSEAAKERMPIYAVMAGNSLGELGEKFKVKWEKIARVNELKKPFTIKEGDRLFIPVNRKNFEHLKIMYQEGKILPSISARQKERRRGKLKVAIIIGLIVSGAGLIFGYIHWQNRQPKQQEFQIGENQEEIKETETKTRLGAFKKSIVTVAIYTAGNGDQGSSELLRDKFNLIGYKTELKGKDTKYSTTSIEYKPGKKDQAEMVKSDLDISGDIELKENANLAVDVAVYNSISKDNFIPIPSTEARAYP